jgi:hypothetical protein
LFLSGREDDVIRLLSDKMNAASQAQQYEEAALYRDQVRTLSTVRSRQYVESNVGVDADVVGSAIDNGIACENLVMVRGGRHVGDRSFFPQNAQQATAGEVLAAFLEQHYLEQPVPAHHRGCGSTSRYRRADRGVFTASAASGQTCRRTRCSRLRSARATGRCTGRMVALRQALGWPNRHNASSA